jgi:hypothetical protein
MSLTNLIFSYCSGIHVNACQQVIAVTDKHEISQQQQSHTFPGEICNAKLRRFKRVVRYPFNLVLRAYTLSPFKLDRDKIWVKCSSMFNKFERTRLNP